MLRRSLQLSMPTGNGLASGAIPLSKCCLDNPDHGFPFFQQAALAIRHADPESAQALQYREGRWQRNPAAGPLQGPWLCTSKVILNVFGRRIASQPVANPRDRRVDNIPLRCGTHLQILRSAVILAARAYKAASSPASGSVAEESDQLTVHRSLYSIGIRKARNSQPQKRIRVRTSVSPPPLSLVSGGGGKRRSRAFVLDFDFLEGVERARFSGHAILDLPRFSKRSLSASRSSSWMLDLPPSSSAICLS